MAKKITFLKTYINGEIEKMAEKNHLNHFLKKKLDYRFSNSTK